MLDHSQQRLTHWSIWLAVAGWLLTLVLRLPIWPGRAPVQGPLEGLAEFLADVPYALLSFALLLGGLSALFGSIAGALIYARRPLNWPRLLLAPLVGLALGTALALLILLGLTIPQL